MRLGAEGTASKFDFGFPAVASTKEVTVPVWLLELRDNLFDHEHARPTVGSAEPYVRDVAMRVVTAVSASDADDLESQISK